MSDSENESESIHSDNSTDDSPGSTVLWFGKHSGERLDKVVKKEISYAEWCRHPDQKRFRWVGGDVNLIASESGCSCTTMCLV